MRLVLVGLLFGMGQDGGLAVGDKVRRLVLLVRGP